LIRSLNENADERVRGMCAWSLGKMGGERAKEALRSRLSKEDGSVREEINVALESVS
jgi:epoxyqueuosine reductase